MTIATVEYIDIGGASLCTTRQGNGPPLVLCHGGPGLWDYLAPVAEMIADLVTVYRYDQRACGRSSGGPPFTVAGAVADLEALRAHWGVPRWIVGGHSWGASLALAYCLAHPERARALVYISGTGIDPAWHAEYHRNRGALLTAAERDRLAELRERLSTAHGAALTEVSREYCEIAWSIDITDRSRARELVKSLFVDGLDVNYEVNRVVGTDANRYFEGGDLRAPVAALSVPTLVIHGAADPRPAWAASALAGLLPNADLRILLDVGHLPWLEHPHLLRDTLRSFLTSLSEE